MIKRLDELTMSRFIDLLCGDMEVLRHKHEIVSAKKLALARRDIVIEYKSIAEIGSVKRFILETSGLTKAKLSSVVFAMCKNLIDMGMYDKAREIMSSGGIKVNDMNDERLAAEVKSRIGRARNDLVKYDDNVGTGEPDEKEIRSGFDSLTASLMAHFKFQIDTSAMKASLYAHLVARFNREIKAQNEAIRKMKR